MQALCREEMLAINGGGTLCTAPGFKALQMTFSLISRLIKSMRR